jgi:hypothetical protein
MKLVKKKVNKKKVNEKKTKSIELINQTRNLNHEIRITQ